MKNTTLRYETNDIGISAALLSLQFSLNQITTDESGRCTFVFDNTPKLQETVTKYLSRELTVEPIIFRSMLRELRSRTPKIPRDSI
jgi:hypothetical protein